MTATLSLKLPKTLVLVGMMGAGKTAIGRRVAKRLALPFVDADNEIVAAAGCPIEDIFKRHGEAAFRDGERRVIERLLEQPVHVLATGGGAYINPQTREKIRRRGISLWLRADEEILWHRVSRRNDRPLLKTENPRETLAQLIETRYPIYATADIVVDSLEGPPEDTVAAVLSAIDAYLTVQGEPHESA